MAATPTQVRAFADITSREAAIERAQHYTDLGNLYTSEYREYLEDPSIPQHFITTAIHNAQVAFHLADRLLSMANRLPQTQEVPCHT